MSFGTTVRWRWLHLEAKKLDPSRSHDFPHQWFAIDSLNHRRSNIILFGKTTELIALQNSLSRVSIYYSVRTQTSDQRAREKKCNISCSEQTRPKYLENYNNIVAFRQDLVQGSICFRFYVLTNDVEPESLEIFAGTHDKVNCHRTISNQNASLSVAIRCRLECFCSGTDWAVRLLTKSIYPRQAGPLGLASKLEWKANRLARKNMAKTSSDRYPA